MRPPANIISAWIKEKNSFSVRGLVMLKSREHGWICNIEILRTSRDKLDQLPPDEAAFEIALSAIFRYITRTVYVGESVPIKTERGLELLVPKIAFEMAPFLVDKIKKILTDGGGGLNVNQIAVSQKLLARATTGDARDAAAYGLPATLPAQERTKHRLNYEAKLTEQEHKAMKRRRRLLARHWISRKASSFYLRGLVYSVDVNGLWAFNVSAGHDVIGQTSSDRHALERLALEVSLSAVQEFASCINFERGGETLLGKDRADQPAVRVPPDVVDNAARRVAKKLLALMDKHQHGVLSHIVIERSLVQAWDAEDTKPLESYPFPFAPTNDVILADKLALDKISAAFKRNRQLSSDAATDAQPADLVEEMVTDEPSAASWREELEIDDWVPLDEVEEDDETLDRKALEKADHDQSSALRRIRGVAGGKIARDDTASPVRHKIDYAGLPSDDA
jgi:hypothetical protein